MKAETLIIDASVAFKWLVEEPDSHLAIGWIGKDELNAPALLQAEVGNALWKSIKRQELPGDAETVDMLSGVSELVSYVDERPAVPRALEIAMRLDHAIYDCIYLAMAEMRNELLLTADERFVRKATLAGFGNLIQSLGEEQ